MRQELEPAALALMRAVKQTLDPRDLFNPGKVIGDPDSASPVHLHPANWHKVAVDAGCAGS
jgi:hypothetical protein